MNSAPTLLITCRACHGSGTITLAHRSGDPQFETIGPCQVPGCVEGAVAVDADQVDELVGAMYFVVYCGQGVTGLTPGALNRAVRSLQAIPGALS
jgi:hypothetical protein